MVVKYNYDAYGNLINLVDTTANNIGTINPIRYKGYYYDEETEMYYCHTRYYISKWRRWLNYDNPSFLDFEDINSMNLFAYCSNNPVMYSDGSGCFAISALIIGALVGAAIRGTVVGIDALAVATVLTGGAAAGAAGFILSGALQGAITGAIGGAISGAVVGGVIGAISEGSWSGFLNGAIDGASSGFMTGAFLGGIGGAVGRASTLSKWDKGTFDTKFASMKNHYARHGIQNGSKWWGNGMTNYTKDALGFMTRNGSNFSLVRGGTGRQHAWTLSREFGSGMNGLYTSAGKIITFKYWYTF